MIILDDMQDKVNERILKMYEEIEKKSEEKIIEVENLKKMFLLNSQTLKDVNIRLNDSEEKILEKVYQVDAKLAAKQDAEIKKRFDRLNDFNTTSTEYKDNLEKEVMKLVKSIPSQNRTALTHYVARSVK